MNRGLRGLLLAGLLIAQPAFAYDAFNNYVPGDTYDFTTGWTIAGDEMEAPLFLPSHIVGCQFEAEATGILAVIRISLHDLFLTGFNQVDVRLHEDASGTLGPIIAAFTRGGLPPAGGADTPETISSFDPDVVLFADTMYWLVVAPGDSTTEAVWNWAPGGGGTIAQSFNGGASYSYAEGRMSVFRVEVISIPEPTTLVLTACFLTGVLIRRPQRSSRGRKSI
jgi:hypothetical protein